MTEEVGARQPLLGIRVSGQGESESPSVNNSPDDEAATAAAAALEGLKPGMGVPAAVVNMVKLMLGCGVLAMGKAFTKSGLWAGVIAYPLLGILCYITMIVLLECQDEARKQIRAAGGSIARVATYRGLGQYAFGFTGRIMVLIAVVSLQLSFCCGYVIVTSDNIAALAKVGGTDMPHWLPVFFIAPLLIGMSWIRWIRDLTFVSVFGTTVYIVGVIGSTVWYGAPRLAPGAYPDVTVPVAWNTLALFCGTALYSLEGINGVLPIAGAMKDRSQASDVFMISILGYCFFVTLFAAFAYIVGFGDADIVVTALPEGVIKIIVQSTLSLALLATHPLQLFPATELLEEDIFGERALTDPSPPRSLLYKRLTLRTFLVIVTCVVGASLPHFSVFADLVGSLFLTFAGFIVPPLLYLRIIGRSRGTTFAVLIAVLLTFGIAFLFFGTYNSLIEMIDSF